MKLPIGVSDFRKVIEGNYTFVDKTNLIKALLDDPSEVVLFTRPRRFGKTINMSMLECFFDCTNEPNKSLFSGLNILDQGDEYTQHLGRYPTIFVSFKSVKFGTITEAYDELVILFSELFKQHRVLLDSDAIYPEDKDFFQRVINTNASTAELRNALKMLSRLLKTHYGEPAVLLIDEYDTPIHASYQGGYYEKMIDIMRGILGTALKDNVYLFKGVLTGILRVAKESIFSGLNNLSVYSFLSDNYGQYFGFTDAEVKHLLDQSIPTQDNNKIYQDCRDWYNGYQSGEHTIYNPWSIINFIEHKFSLKPYWVNTSDNALIKILLATTSFTSKEIFEKLLQGGSTIQQITENTVFQNLYEDHNALWSFLLFSGYLKINTIEWTEEGYPQCVLSIPNKEVMGMFHRQIKEWLPTPSQSNHDSLLMDALLHGKLEILQSELSSFLEHSFSYFDIGGKTPENVYHAFILGVIATLRDRYIVRSNRESGYGRYDVMIIPLDKSLPGIVIEFKSIDPESSIETITKSASESVKQVMSKQYHSELKQEGITDIITYGMTFAGKKVLVAFDRQK